MKQKANRKLTQPKDGSLKFNKSNNTKIINISIIKKKEIIELLKHKEQKN